MSPFIFPHSGCAWIPDEVSGISGAELISADAHLAISPVDASPTAERVLLVDDNADMRSYVARLLGRRWQVVTAADGEIALQMARSNPPDLVLSDVMMPGLDGFGLLTALRADERTKDIPVLLLSARAGEEANVEGFNSGADDYITKPFSARELIARVAANLAMRRLRKDNTDRERQLREELARSNAELTQFAGIAAHDLQEPLRMVTNYLGLIELRHHAALPREALTFLEYARDGALRMSRLVAALFGYAQIASGNRLFTRVSLAKIADEVMQNLNQAITEAGATVTVEALPKVQGDPALLSQVLQNLIANALKYRSQQPPVIRLSAARSDRGDEWVVSVTDNGIGIAPEDHPRLFQLFSCLRTDTKIPGTGIGLASSRRIVEIHGGRIWVDSTRGEGATFRFTLPAAP